LEGVTLEAVARQGWSLACLEINMEGALLTRFARNGHPAYRGGSSRQIWPKDLVAEAEITRKQFEASTMLCMAYSKNNEEHDISLLLITPHGEKEHHLTYGGHPGNARRWGVNMAMEWLRRTAMETG
jgi:hypothetical protein